MLRKDDILLTQPALWSKLKVYGKTIKYVQLLTPNLSSNVSVFLSANQVGSYITILEPSLVGHKVYVKITADTEKIGLCFFKEYGLGLMAYNLLNGEELYPNTEPTSATEGVFTITQDMVHSETNYLQLYYFVYKNCTFGTHTITVQLVDLTELGMDNIINPVLFNATDLGKYMQNNTLNRGSGLISVESPLSCYKNGTLVRTLNLIKEGNHIKLNGIGDLKDTYTNYNGKYNKVLGEVDLGTLNWTYQSAQARFIATNIATLIKKPLATTEKANMYCVKYTTSDWSSAGGKDKVVYLNTNGNLGIRDNAYTDAQTFKTAMSGVKLIYELAMPTTETLSSKMIPSGITEIIDKNGVGVEYKKQ